MNGESLTLHIIALVLVMFLAPSCVMESSQDALFDARQKICCRLDSCVGVYFDAVLKESER